MRFFTRVVLERMPARKRLTAFGLFVVVLGGALASGGIQ